MSLDSSQFSAGNMFVAKDVLVRNEVVFDVAAFQVGGNPPKRVQVSTSKAVLGPEFWIGLLLQQMKKYGFDVIRTNLLIGKTSTAIKFDEIVFEQTQHILATSASAAWRVFTVSVQDDVFLGGGKRQSPPSASTSFQHELYSNVFNQNCTVQPIHVRNS